MRVSPHLKTLIALTTFATLAACIAPARHGPSGVTVVTVWWDPGPLDRDYSRQHTEMIARHHSEEERPVYDESAETRHKRQHEEDKDLQKRYKQGKKEHRDAMPGAER